MSISHRYILTFLVADSVNDCKTVIENNVQLGLTDNPYEDAVIVKSYNCRFLPQIILIKNIGSDQLLQHQQFVVANVLDTIDSVLSYRECLHILGVQLDDNHKKLLALAVKNMTEKELRKFPRLTHSLSLFDIITECGLKPTDVVQLTYDEIKTYIIQRHKDYKQKYDDYLNVMARLCNPIHSNLGSTLFVIDCSKSSVDLGVDAYSSFYAIKEASYNKDSHIALFGNSFVMLDVPENTNVMQFRKVFKQSAQKVGDQSQSGIIQLFNFLIKKKKRCYDRIIIMSDVNVFTDTRPGTTGVLKKYMQNQTFVDMAKVCKAYQLYVNSDTFIYTINNIHSIIDDIIIDYKYKKIIAVDGRTYNLPSFIKYVQENYEEIIKQEKKENDAKQQQ